MPITTDQTLILKAPPSKSLSHRYLVGAALTDGVSVVRHLLLSRDLARTEAILKDVGAIIQPLTESEGDSIIAFREDCRKVAGMGGVPRGGTNTFVSCHVEESGTTCRLLTAVLAAGEGLFHIHGSERMHERPLGALTTALERLGASINFSGNPGRPPLLLTARGLDPTRCDNVVDIDMDESSQYFSALLLAAPLGAAPLTIALTGTKAVSWPYVGLTLQCLHDFSICFAVETRPDPKSPWTTLADETWRNITEVQPHCLRVTVQPGAYRPGTYVVEGDWSGASYLLAAGALGKTPVRVENLRADSLQGDRAMLTILEKMGARLRIEPTAVTVMPSALHGVELDMGHCPDLVPTVAVLAAFAKGTSRINNVAHLRIKESDRIAAPAEELAKVGVTVEQANDGMLVHGRGEGALRLPAGTMFSAHNDHRMAMSLALLGLAEHKSHAEGIAFVRARLDDPSTVAKSFPNFWEIWEQPA